MIQGVEQCDQYYDCVRMTFDHTIATSNCAFFPKTKAVDHMTRSLAIDSAVVAGSYYPDPPYTYRGRDSSYDLATCPSDPNSTPPHAGYPQVRNQPPENICDNEDIQSPHGPSSCYYTVRCTRRYFGTLVANFKTATWSGCLDAFDKNLNGDSMSWQSTTGTCIIFSDTDGGWATLPNWWSAFYHGGCG